jgi:hypothetical protein
LRSQLAQTPSVEVVQAERLEATMRAAAAAAAAAATETRKRPYTSAPYTQLTLKTEQEHQHQWENQWQMPALSEASTG